MIGLAVCWCFAYALGWATRRQFKRGAVYAPGLTRDWWRRDTHPAQFWTMLSAYALSTAVLAAMGVESAVAMLH